MNDGGLIAVLAQWAVDTLKALKYNDIDVFKTVDIWKHQVGITASGQEASGRYQPFAFVGSGDEDSTRQGGDLRRSPGIKVMIGVDAKEDGVAQWGDATHPGTSKIRDLVIVALDEQRPNDAEITCDEFYYDHLIEILDMPKRHWVQLNFTVGQIIESEE
jgi:hypothetical protein